MDHREGQQYDQPTETSAVSGIDDYGRQGSSITPSTSDRELPEADLETSQERAPIPKAGEVVDFDSSLLSVLAERDMRFTLVAEAHPSKHVVSPIRQHTSAYSNDEYNEGGTSRLEVAHVPKVIQVPQYVSRRRDEDASEFDSIFAGPHTVKRRELCSQSSHVDTDTTVEDESSWVKNLIVPPLSSGGMETRRAFCDSSSPASAERSGPLPLTTVGCELQIAHEGASLNEELAGNAFSPRPVDVLTDASGAVVERMKYEPPEDPRNYIINIIINSEPGSVTLQSIHELLNWDERFAEANGTVLDYLQGYQSIFAVCPLDDRVTMRQPLKAGKGRRRLKGKIGYHAMSNRVGSVSCCYVARKFDLDLLSALYKRRGYRANIVYDALHVSSFHTFDMFLFSNGVVVWWGMNRADHWIVEDDFLSSDVSFVSEAIHDRHEQKNIDELFPIWRSYETDRDGDDTTTTVGRKQALERFSTNICFEHYLIPCSNPLRYQVMLTVSYALGRISVVDFFDHMTQKFHKEVLNIPSEIQSPFDYFSAQRQIRRLEGELHIAIMAITELFDTPDFLWEMAWLYDYHEIAERQNSSEKLFSWFIAKSEALLQQLASIKSRRHRFFMLGSDVFLILLLMADVFFMMTTFVLRLYFF